PFPVRLRLSDWDPCPAADRFRSPQIPDRLRAADPPYPHPAFPADHRSADHFVDPVDFDPADSLRSGAFSKRRKDCIWHPYPQDLFEGPLCISLWPPSTSFPSCRYYPDCNGARSEGKSPGRSLWPPPRLPWPNHSAPAYTDCSKDCIRRQPTGDP